MQADGPNQAEKSYIGVDLSGPTLRAALVSAAGEVARVLEAPLEREQLVEQIARVVADLRGGTSVEALGVGLPGLVDPRTGRVHFSTDLPLREEFYADLAGATGLPLLLENDANAAAYGEYVLGAGRASQSIFYVMLGYGIGGALIFDGQIWRGASGFAGEFGHITIDPDGIQCACGNVGCLETVASAPNIVRRTHERLFRDSTSSLSKLAVNRDFTVSDITREARNGDDFALLMIERTGRYIGTAIAAIINLLNVERIILGGIVMEAGELLLDPIIREARRRSFQPCFETTQIVAAQLGLDSVLIGAALLAAQKAGA
ncbi:ROK family protein [Pyrinomonas methylaliphatogenes]|uniref:Transcriptional regulator/sugar kinase n=1 Tax=Pyrinomonas methylaliphatogenes TaxID=454194 RepID=A0A0B6X1R6_9BACT|nr:ROK family protein [Pyrinomonas methylaliphatogenes]CDM66315.1 transcriptional regulator/sugar kinase [Pyrinomonas methylaliphatogenes]